MDWFQLIVAIIGSSVLTALVTGFFNQQTIKEANAENERKRDFEIKQKQEVATKESIKEKAENLYKIISPALECQYLLFYIKSPNKYHEDAFGCLYKAINGDDFYMQIYKKYIDWLKKGEIKFLGSGELPFDEYVKNLIEQDLKRQTDLSFFFQRYNKGTSESIDIDVEKLNIDIDFVNKELNLYIEKF